MVAFAQGLTERGWIVGQNVRIDYRWAAGEGDRFRQYAAELVALAPDVLLGSGTLSVRALQPIAGPIAIVFTRVTDPVGAGFVDSLSRPGGNITGFMLSEYSLSGKWLELLKQIAPNVTRVAVLRDSANPAGIGQFSAIQALAPSLGVQVTAVNVRDGGEIERAIAIFAHSPNGGVIVTPSAAATTFRDQVLALGAKYRLPSVYRSKLDLSGGSLLSYGPDSEDDYRLAAGYVDRILKGERPADLPVQAPTKYELVISRKAAQTLGLTVPSSLLARADEVIE
jgi:putative ABC transport system substrate-binding protein